jgi:hypothetical protein
MNDKLRIWPKKSLHATIEVLRDNELMRQIRASKRHFARGGKGLTFKQVFGQPLPKQTGKRR